MKHGSKLNKTELLLLKMLWQMPYASAGDLALWPMAPSGRVYPNLLKLVERGFVAYETLGWMRDAQRRYFLTTKGVRAVMQQTGWPMHWAVTASGRSTIRSYGPMLECLYDAAPRVWDPGWTLVKIHPTSPGFGWAGPDQYGPNEVEDDDPVTPPVIHPEPSPDSFTWLRQGPLAALVGMQQGPDAHRFWVPLVWYGTHPPKSSLPGHFSQLFSHLRTENDRASQLRCFPPGVVIVAADLLAAARAARECPPTLRRAIVTCETQTDQQRRFKLACVTSSLETEFPHGLGRVVGANSSI